MSVGFKCNQDFQEKGSFDPISQQPHLSFHTSCCTVAGGDMSTHKHSRSFYPEDDDHELPHQSWAEDQSTTQSRNQLNSEKLHLEYLRIHFQFSFFMFRFAGP